MPLACHDRRSWGSIKSRGNDLPTVYVHSRPIHMHVLAGIVGKSPLFRGFVKGGLYMWF